MIVIEDVHKRYMTDHGPSKWILRGVTVTIPQRVNVGLVGRNGAGKSTLMRIIGGTDRATIGRIERRCRVSWPMGRGGALMGNLTARQNALFVCRVQGHHDDITERLEEIEKFADLGDYFNEPVSTYSAGMRSRLQFALSFAFDFDIYIIDELIGAGDATFRKKAEAAFAERADHAGLIMVSHSDTTLRQFCDAGIWLHEGTVRWFDDIDDALAAYEESTRA
jgi:capsular polysaccharide transport system ATP-binding protein